MSVTDRDLEPARAGGVDWAKDDHAVCIVGAGRRELPVHDQPRRGRAEDMVRRLLAPGRRGRDRTPRRAGRGRPAAGRADRVGHPARPGEEPAVPVRLRRQQGRPVRRLRAGRRGPHRPAPAAPAGRRHRGHHRAAQHVRARKDMVVHRVAVANQLRAHLQIVFPAAAGLFADIDSDDQPAVPGPVHHPGPGGLALGEAAGAWLASVGYSGRTDPAVLHARLTAAPAAPPARRRHPAAVTAATSRCCAP